MALGILEGMKSLVRFSIMTLGIVCFFLGVVGLFIPIMQGILFLIIGLYLLTITSKRCKALLEKALAKFPKIKKIYETHVEKFEKIWKGDSQPK